MALNTVRQLPQRTFPARARICSEVTRKVVWQLGQQVCTDYSLTPARHTQPSRVSAITSDRWGA